MVTSNGLFQSLHNLATEIRVEDALMSYDRSRFDRVSVVAFCGIVELSGVVSNYYDKALALRIAGQVTGVSTVVESIEIRQSNSVPRPMMRRRPRPIPFYHNLTTDRGTGKLDPSSG